MTRRARAQRSNATKPASGVDESSRKSKLAAAGPAQASRKPSASRTGKKASDVVPNEWHKRSAELNPKYKSQLCKSFMEKGATGCRFGADCVFAHGAHELRSAQPDEIVAKTRRPRGGNKSNKGGRTEPKPTASAQQSKPRVQFREGPDELLCRECDSRPVSPVHDEQPEPLPEWATAEVAPAEEPGGGMLLARSNSILAADRLFLDETIDTTTVGDTVVYGEEASPNAQLNSRFSFATVTPRELPAQWVSTQVVAWVRSRGIPEDVAALFAEHEVEGEDLLSMTKEELQEVGVTKMGHLKKLIRGITELNGSSSSSSSSSSNGSGGTDATTTATTTAAVTNTSNDTKPESSTTTTTTTSTVSKDLKDLDRWAALAPTVPLAQAVGPSQLIAEAADVIRRSDNVTGLNEVLQSAVMANKIAEVIRSEGMPLTLCMLAAKHRRVDCLQRLLRELPAQETVNATRVEDGCTALHLAAYSGSAGCVNLLLDAGADTSLVNRYAETPADCAAKQQYDSLSALLRQAAAAAAVAGTSVAAGGGGSNGSQKMLSSPPRLPSGFVKIQQPRRHAKKSRNTLASELSAWRSSGGAASAA
jgi:hypothetical protein